MGDNGDVVGVAKEAEEAGREDSGGDLREGREGYVSQGQARKFIEAEGVIWAGACRTDWSTSAVAKASGDSSPLPGLSVLSSLPLVIGSLRRRSPILRSMS